MNNEQYLIDFQNTDWEKYLDSTGVPNKGGVTPYLRFIWWVKKATDTFNNRFEYDFSSWINGNSKTSVICPIHGVHSINARSHLNSKGCPSCTKNLPATGGSVQYWKDQLKDFESNNKHVEIVWPDIKEYKCTTKISYVCKEHGVHTTTLGSLYKSKSCHKCSSLSAGKNKRNNIIKLLSILEKLNISVVEDTYTSYNANATFICKEHGESFVSRVSNVVYGITKYGCKKCKDKYKPTGVLDEELFREEFTESLNARDINIVKVNTSHSIEFSCNICDTKWTSSKQHVCVELTGCPNCATQGPTYLYLLKDSTLGIYKIGISVNPESRIATLNKYFDFTLLKSKRLETKLDAYNLEQKLHKLFSNNQYKELLDVPYLDGKTELFSFSDKELDAVLEYYK